jgi:amidase
LDAPDPITALSACDLSEQIHARRVSCREVMTAYLDRIEALNPVYNAIVSLQPRDVLLAQADARDATLARGEALGWMHGFPMAIKDLAATAGIRTTEGSPLLADNVPVADDLMVARMKSAGGIVIGKTNTPEFGLGSSTYNRVFGITRNAIDPSRTAGGSSGGAAVSLALRLQPVADGSDMMGSLRNPAAFNGVYGFRPSPGRVPGGAPGSGFIEGMGTEGPMARSVRDLAMLLSVQAGPDRSTPLSIDEPGDVFAGSLDADPRGVRVGWLGDLAGYLPIESGILEACERGLERLESIGCVVEPAALGYAPEQIWQAWITLRSWLMAGGHGPRYRDPAQRTQLKPEVAWEVERGLRLTGPEVYAAHQERTTLYHHLLGLFERYDILALPTAQVWPFAADVLWPAAIGGVDMDTYHRWMEVTIYATLGGLPALNVPVGRDDDELPMGMQLMGRSRADLAVLALGHAYEGVGRPAGDASSTLPGT